MVWIWLLLSAGLLMTELLIGEMTALMLGFGALAAAVPAALGLGWPFQVLAFALVAPASLIFLRPLLRGWLQPPQTGLSTDGFIGQQAEVLEAISPERRGRVKLHGEIWNAFAYEAIGPGEPVIVTALRDNQLEVVSRAALGAREPDWSALQAPDLLEVPRQSQQQALDERKGDHA